MEDEGGTPQACCFPSSFVFCPSSLPERTLIRFRCRVICSFVACLLMVYACGPSGDSANTNDSLASPDTPAVTPAVTPADSTASAAPATPPPPSGSAVPSGSHVALDGSGIMLIAAESGATRALAFGTPVDVTLTAISRVLGDPIVRTTNRDCGAGPIEFIAFDGGLFVGVQNNRFAGWTVRPSGSKALRTMSNIGIGSTRAALDAAYNVRVTRSTIGTEFMAGGLQGVLASDAANAAITDLWAGAHCVAR